MSTREPLIRDLEQGDLFNGFLLSLDTLREASSIAPAVAKSIFEKIKSNPHHIILVAEAERKIAGSITLLVEQKFIHNGSRAGHIEDVVVSSTMQRRGIGAKLVKAALRRASDMGCYKTTLECTDDVKAFYQRLGFECSSNGMRYNH